MVDTSVSMTEPVQEPGGPPVDPWEAMLTTVDSIACLEDDVQARAQFQLRLMPGPVGADVCGRSDALDITDWVSAAEIKARLSEVVPQGGRSMRRALEDLPADADLIVLLSHGAPGCGDDISPEVLDTTVAETVTEQGASVVVSGIALPSGTTPIEMDFEPDGVDPEQELRSIGQVTETECIYHIPLLPAEESACINVEECLYGNRLHPCSYLGSSMQSEVDDLLVWVGGDPVPRVDTCGSEPAWSYAGELFGGWLIWLCTEDLCLRRWNEGMRLQHSCNPDAPG